MGGATVLLRGAGVAAAIAALSFVVQASGRDRPIEAWPNEPAGLPLVADQGWEHLGGKWTLLWGKATIASDPGAPGSPPTVLRIDFPAGFIGGAAPGTEAIRLPRCHTIYVGLWWYASDPWQGHPSNSNKLQYLYADPKGTMAMMMYGVPGGPYEMRVFPDWHGEWLRSNVRNVPLTLGTWHRVEWLVIDDGPHDPPTGVVRWWIDGALAGDHANVRLADGPMVQYAIAPVWGGAEAVPKEESDYFLYDHTRVRCR